VSFTSASEQTSIQLLMDFQRQKNNSIFNNFGFTGPKIAKLQLCITSGWELSGTLLVEVSVLSGSITFLWPTSFGLFACLEFGPGPFSLPFLGAFFL
jgi:hypothetical protein